MLEKSLLNNEDYSKRELLPNFNAKMLTTLSVKDRLLLVLEVLLSKDIEKNPVKNFPTNGFNQKGMDSPQI